MEKKVEKLEGFESVKGEETVNMAGGERWNYDVYVVTADGGGSKDGGEKPGCSCSCGCKC